MILGIRDIYEAARAAGFSPDQATTWTAIALAESGGESGAHNPDGEDSRGLWQINVDSRVRANVWGDLSDPYANARAAYDISQHGLDMRPWTTTHASHAGTSTDYRTYLAEVSVVTGYAGDARGVEGYDSPLPESPSPSGPADTPAGPVSYDAIDLGAQPGSDVDADQDGLTDAFELLVSSDPAVADTDQDSLSDAYEAGVSHSSPLLADSDADAMSDAAETALGTSPVTFDTDQDGPSDGLETQLGSDPLRADRAVDATLAVSASEGAPAPAAAPQTASLGTTSTTPVVTGQPGVVGATQADAFVDVALAQKGDDYVFGAEADLDTANPDTFDCSELTQWAAGQVGVTMPDGAMYQYLDLKGKGQLLPVDEALHTKGALLFYFSSEPTAGGGRPSAAHVAISLGDGRTIEARGTNYGVNEFGGADRFNYAGVIPGMEGAVDPLAMNASYDQIDTGSALGSVGDTDGDGLSDLFEQTHAFDPASADTDLDGRDDGLELIDGTDPRAADRVGLATAVAMNGLPPEADEDVDSLSNAFEVEHGLDPRLADTDQDELSDAAELALGTDPTAVDTDLDGRRDGPEMVDGTDPRAADRVGLATAVAMSGLAPGADEDSDSLGNEYEVERGLDPRLADTDQDGLSDAAELVLGTDPTAMDTDLDGFTDRAEIDFGTDPFSGEPFQSPAPDAGGLVPDIADGDGDAF